LGFFYKNALCKFTVIIIVKFWAKWRPPGNWDGVDEGVWGKDRG